jgi:vacuolar-type H+-ATPase subunit I/STV1
MTRGTVLTAALIASLLGLVGCSQEQAKKPEQAVQQATSQPNAQIDQDLTAYLLAEEKAMQPWAKIEKMTENLAKVKSAKVYVSTLKNEFTPLVTGVITQMEAIKPATKEVQAIHAAYTASLRDYLAGLGSMAEAVEKSDEKLAAASAEKLNGLAAAHAKFIADSKALAAANRIAKPM